MAARGVRGQWMREDNEGLPAGREGMPAFSPRIAPVLA
jgi:hypothetical protein